MMYLANTRLITEHPDSLATCCSEENYQENRKKIYLQYGLQTGSKWSKNFLLISVHNVKFLHHIISLSNHYSCNVHISHKIQILMANTDNSAPPLHLLECSVQCSSDAKEIR